MRKRRNFRKKPKDNAVGLSVTVYNNNVDGALRILKKKINNWKKIFKKLITCFQNINEKNCLKNSIF